MERYYQGHSVVINIGNKQKQKFIVFDIKDFYHASGWKKMVIVWCDNAGLWWSRSKWTCWDLFISIGFYHDNGLPVFKNSILKNKKELTKNIQGLWFRNSGRI